MSQSLDQLADIKPGHPIWDEVWERSRPGGISHLSQLFEAKLQVEALQRENTDLHNQLIEVTDHRCTLVKENERLKAPVSDEEWRERPYMYRRSVDALIASRATQPAPQGLFNCTCESDVLGRCVVHETSVKRDVQSPMAGGESREKPATQSTENGK